MSDERSLLLSMIALTAVTGLVDAASFLGLGQIFTANMTGNVALLGFALAGVDGFSIPALLTSIACFLVGAVAGGRAAAALAPRHRGRWLTAAIGVEVAVTAGAALMAVGAASHATGPQRYAVIVALALAMGLRNATVRRAGVADLSTTVLTSTLTGLAADSRLAGGSGAHSRRRVAAVVSMLVGALIGALLTRGSLALPLAAAALLGLVPLLAVSRLPARPAPAGS